MDGNLEIEKALEEFEQSAQKEQVIKTVAKEKLDEPSRMIKLVMKYSGGAIKEERQAEYVLLSFAILFFLISFYLFFGDYSYISKIRLASIFQSFYCFGSI